MKKWIDDIFYSFPVQLVVLHLRNNLLLIVSWLVLGLLMTGKVGKLFGVNFLFLSPEYLGEVNFISFYFLGVAFGSFFISWNLTTYMLDAHLFPFLACLSRPFTKFCLNNFIIPLVFLFYYFYYTIHFQWYFEYWSGATVAYNMLGFILGFITLVLLASVYFQLTNKDVFTLVNKQKKLAPKSVHQIEEGKTEKEMVRFRTGENQWRVETYLTESLKPRLVRSVDHYDDKLLLSVFKQNHLNALIVQLFGLVLLLTLGCLIDNAWFRMPAGASVFILASVLVAVTGAIVYWFNRWSLSIFLLLLLGINFITGYNIFNHKNNHTGVLLEVGPPFIQNL